jgi:hypothetical protein
MAHVSDKHDVEFITYLMHVRHKFAPKLEIEEHTEFVWAPLDHPPEPLHPGVATMIDEYLGRAPEQAQDYTVHGAGFGKFYSPPISSRPINHEPVKNDLVHASPPSTKHDESSESGRQGISGDKALAFDRASVRTIDADGRMHVEITNISKACVNPYFGREIPGADALGLEPDKVYMLLRDPAELEKGASTFNNIQLLDIHDPVSADEPKKEITIGSTGTDAVFEAPYLRNSLVIWDAEAIKRIESKETQELSCAYRYVPVMEPGAYEGEQYDGRMTQIVGNHVALVAQGRAGPDVVVGDSALPSRSSTLNGDIPMSKPLSKKAAFAKGVLLAVLKPQFAADAMPDLDTILSGVGKKNWQKKKPGIVAAIQSKMAKDADIESLVELLDSLDNVAPSNTDLGVDSDDEGDGDKAIEEVLASLRGKISDEDLKVVEEKIRAMATPVAHLAPAAGAEDTPPPFEGKPAVGKGPEEAPVTKEAMDAAIKLAEDAAIARVNAIHDARKVVAPFVGELALAYDSAEAVYKAALKTLGIATKGIHPDAYRSILEAQPKPGAKSAHVVMAADAFRPSGYAKQCEDLGIKAL